MIILKVNGIKSRPQDVGEKENVVLYNKFIVVRKGHGSQPSG